MKPQNSSTLAVTVIAYRRADKLHLLLETLATYIDLHVHIFCDGARSETEQQECFEVQRIAKKFESKHRFFEVTIRDRNYGLNQNICKSITESLQDNAFTLVLEEDVIPTSEFLSFLKQAEPMHRNNPEVFSIAGYHPVNHEKMDLTGNSAFFSRRFFCWGWATWADRWHALLPSLDGTSWPFEHYWQIPATTGSDLAWAHRRHRMGRKDLTWDRLICLWSLKLNLIHLCPPCPLTKNIGLDGSGENCALNDKATQIFVRSQMQSSLPVEYPGSLSTEARVDAEIAQFYTNRARGSMRKFLHYNILKLFGLKSYKL
ncbi:hypothetical protein [Prosthecobacter sp.]